MKILYKIATRSRPALFHRAIMSIIDNSESDNYHILVSVDNNDGSSNYTNVYKNTSIVFGNSKNKIDAINRDIDTVSNWDILVNVSDDQTFTLKGFDKVIRSNFDKLDLCLHFPDGNRNDLITMSILGRDFYNRFGYIYSPEYKSLYCDNEQMEVSKMLGCYKFVNENIMLHLHPAFGKANYDKQYHLTESFSSEDCQTFLKRKVNNFDLEFRVDCK